MRSRLIVVGVLTALLGLSSCWFGPGAGPDNNGFNPDESRLTVENVATLSPAFRLPDHGTPAVYGNRLFATTTNAEGGPAVQALNGTTGAVLWTQPATGNPWPFGTTPAVLSPDGGTVQVSVVQATGRGAQYLDVVHVDSRTGAVVGQDDAGPGGPGVVAQRGDALLLYNEDRPYKSCDFCFVYGRWLKVPGHALDGIVDGSLHDGHLAHRPTLGTNLVWLPDASGNNVSAFDIDQSCPVGFSEPICHPTWSTPVDGLATSVVAEEQARNSLYLGTSAGTAYALDASTGAVRWSTPLGAGAITQVPAFDGALVYYATDAGAVIAIDPSSGAVRWRSTLGAAPTAQPAVAGGVVYVGASDGTVRAFAAAGCSASPCGPVWSTDAGGSIDGVVPADGHLYVTVGSGITVYAPTS